MTPTPPPAPARPVVDPEDALVELDTRSGFEKFLDAVAAAFPARLKGSGR